jgi:hypothetical protein
MTMSIELNVAQARHLHLQIDELGPIVTLGPQGFGEGSSRSVVARCLEGGSEQVGIAHDRTFAEGEDQIWLGHLVVSRRHPSSDVITVGAHHRDSTRNKVDGSGIFDRLRAGIGYDALVVAMEIIYGLVIGTAAGAVSGLAIALAHLKVKNLRNAIRVRRGLGAIRDEILGRIYLPTTVLGALVGSVAAPRMGLGWTGVAACTPALLFGAIVLPVALWQAYGDKCAPSVHHDEPS